MSERDGKRMCVFGKSGSGKTYFVNRIIAKVPRLIVFDPKRSYRKEGGYQTVTDLAALLVALQAGQGGSFRIVYEPTPFREAAELHEVAKLVERLQVPYLDGKFDLKVMIVNEEAHAGIPNPPDPKLNGFGRLIQMGREMGIDVISVTQRPQSMAKFVRENVDRIACFAVSGNDAAKTAADAMMAEDAKAEIVALKPREFVLWDEIDGWTRKPPLT